ncbi:hypothetical protein C6P46_000084 [Rhodotorula mucilaginosa]|uniref:Uncharacterized protein n=1 Tax=Rhodotorula mucilaginosa TaxID=5537 RepID=A0A9P6W8D7_RHOMI|nr:hypothetical protein C6P46_000084 [Rhodotorula mucilaginosa]
MSAKAPLAGPPPAAPLLETSNSRLSLSLQVPPPGVCFPGQALHPVVCFKGDTKYEKLSLSLHAETPVRVWGKDRWQAGAIASGTLGGGGGVPVTSLERSVFVDQEIPFSSSGRRDDGDSKNHHDHHTSDASPADGVYEFVLPGPPHGQLLPSLATADGQSDGDHPLEVQTVKSLKYSGSGNQTLAVAARLVCDAPTHSEATLRYGLSLTPADPATRALLDSALSPDPAAAPIKTSATLARQVRTAPVKAENGQDFNWAAVRVAGGTLAREVRASASGKEAAAAFEWVGELKVPSNHHTIRSQYLDVNYVLNCHLRSSIFPDGDLHLSLLLPLPSVPAELADLGTSSDLEPEQSNTASGSVLPPYAP